MDWNRLGSRLRRLREVRGLTQRELANRAGVARNTVTLIETGARPASIRLMERLAKILGVKLVDLLR